MNLYFQSSPRYNEPNGLCLGSPKTKNSLSTPRGCIGSLDPRWCHMVNQLEHWRFSQCGVSPSAKHSLYNLYTTHEEIHISISQRGQYRDESNILYFSKVHWFSLGIIRLQPIGRMVVGWYSFGDRCRFRRLVYHWKKSWCALTGARFFYEIDWFTWLRFESWVLTTESGWDNNQ